VFSLVDKEGFQVIWRYFSWANQVLAMVTLWTVTVFLVQHKPRTLWYLITLIPALFMSMVTISFIFVAQKEGFGSLIPRNVGYILAAVVTLLFFAIFVRWMARFNKNAKK
jgi:carbon starvation protein CstA